MTDVPIELEEQLREHDQEHLLDMMTDTLLEQLSPIDFDELAALTAKAQTPAESLPAARIEPLPVESRESILASIARGEQALRDGEVAVLVVAGGQGTRLGFDKPKGMYPVGPVSNASLFQIHAEKVLALQTRYETRIPFLVMTSSVTHDDTIDFFESNNFFGLAEDLVFFFEQGSMPAVDIATGKLLLEGPDKLALSPNGHGGTLTALADSGLLTALQKGGFRHIFYFQVDNPLVNIADPAFLGRHIETESQASSKVIFKENPDEKVGLLTLLDGHCGIIEYSDLPKELAHARADDGTLLYRAGNPAIHLFSLEFLDKVTSGDTRLHYHVARKKVPHYDIETQSVITPETENAFKFELFIFDALPMADRWLAVSVPREDEFAPLKNASGNDSLATLQALMIGQATRWLTAAGVTVPPNTPVEISPLFALDEKELKAKLASETAVVEPTYFEIRKA